MPNPLQRYLRHVSMAQIIPFKIQILAILRTLIQEKVDTCVDISTLSLVRDMTSSMLTSHQVSNVQICWKFR